MLLQYAYSVDSTDFAMDSYKLDKVKINGKRINVRGGKTYTFTLMGNYLFIILGLRNVQNIGTMNDGPCSRIQMKQWGTPACPRSATVQEETLICPRSVTLINHLSL